MKEAKVEETKDYSKLTVAELREMAKEQNISGYSTMKKADLLANIK
ncbi:MAG: Rho termination factor N-terminal domain-containing protein [Bacilli bacterium]|nr:Rho termination factor N-terminal domain-containing protein [Bacilli bacterium]